ncbi:MAG TPA: hypothetical protein VN226_00990 [Anaerolineales bacterium]|nr:hypothetical protein [Anaerolineales bacterium]
MKTLKIVIISSFGAGKTTFIETAKLLGANTTFQNEKTDPDLKQLTSIATDQCEIHFDEDMRLYLFGVPSQQRFDFIWEIIENKSHGFIILFDSSKPETFFETRKMIDFVYGKTHAPYIVAANPTNPEFAWEEVSIRNALKLSSQIKYVTCDATNRDSVKNTILEMLYEILSKIDN